MGKGTVRAYLELCRASNLPTVWTNVLAAVVLSGGQLFSWATLAVALSLTLTYLGGMALNDVLDVEEDRVKKPFRPIPSGRVSVAGAGLFASALFGIGFLLLLWFCPWTAGAANGALLVAVYLYDRLHRLHPATVLLMASCRGLVWVVAAIGVGGALGWNVLIGATVQFAYVVALTLVARWEKHTTRKLPIPPIPWLLAGISLVDGILLAVLAHPAWLVAGLGGAVATRLAQTKVAGD